MDELERIRQRKLEMMMKEIQGKKSEDLPTSPIEVSDSTLSSLLQKYPNLVVDCWAPWCGPCYMVAPVVEELARELAGKVVFGKLNVDNNQETARRFGIMSIPTLLVFKNGKLEDQIIGAVPRSHIEYALKKHSMV